MSKIEFAPIHDYAKSAYLAYAMAVVKGRAIPDIEDGLKPVQRRILYAMSKLRLNSNAKPMKSARVVGDVLGQYHPHGDGATYEAMVRMAQPFSLRYPLVHGEGNFGSRDGDAAAAYRYTEAKMTPLAEALLEELAWETVDFKPTFDAATEEPVTLPARLPFLLLNGASGIGVGLATEFPSHNMREVVAAAIKLIQDPKASEDAILDLIPGPDFPTGGALMNLPEDIRKIYKEGRGSFRVRSRWKVEGDAKKWQLVFDELPYTTSIKKVSEEVDALMDPKAKEKNGKKLPLSPEQARIKKLFNDLISEYGDGSDKDNPLRFVVKPADRKTDPDALAKLLCAHTSLEDNYPANLVAVDDEGTPRQLGLHAWLAQWCNYRVETVRRRLTDEKNRVDRRLHILAGRLTVLDRIQEVVRWLTEEEKPEEKLAQELGLDEIQIQDIMELRLRQLARLENYKLKNEQETLLKEQGKLAKLLASDRLIRNLVIQELESDVKRFGDDRRTILTPEATTGNARQKANDDLAAQVNTKSSGPDPIALVMTDRGWIAWRPMKKGEDPTTLEYKIKAGDQIKRGYIGDRNQDYFLVLDEQGRVYSLKLSDLPSKADTAPLSTWFDLAAKPVEGCVTSPDQRWMVASNGGYGFVVKANDAINRMKAGKAFLTLETGNIPLPPVSVPFAPEEAAEEPQVRIWSSEGKALAFPYKELKSFPKGKGVALMGLPDNATVQGLVFVEDPQQATAALHKGKSFQVQTTLWEGVLGPRSSSKKGKIIHPKLAETDQPGWSEAIMATVKNE